MLPFSYEDRFPDTTFRQGYGATNEEPLLIKQVIKPFNKGLAICSAGEVTFLALLPKTRESLVLIDHCYSSLRAFCLKALLLTTLGPVATRALLLKEDVKAWMDATAKLVDSLPSSLTKSTVTDLVSVELANVRREWFYADLPSLHRTCKNLHKIKLVHGDLLDAQDRAPYDFIYLSNALEHTSRMNVKTSQPYASHYPSNGANPCVKTLSSKLLRKGSSIMWVQANGASYGSNKVASDTWKLQQRIKGYRTTWQYMLSIHDGTQEVQVPVPTAPPIKTLISPKAISLGPYITSST